MVIILITKGVHGQHEYLLDSFNGEFCSWKMRT